MILCGQSFDFSPLNAADLDRADAAYAAMQRASEAEHRRPYERLGDMLRGQCRLVMDYLDGVLGEGASVRLGLDGNDFAACQRVMTELENAMTAALRTPTAPQNRAQRRAQKKHGKAKPVIRYPQNTPYGVMNLPQPETTVIATQAADIAVRATDATCAVNAADAARPAAARMVERVDKAARREQLLAELAALDNG